MSLERSGSSQELASDDFEREMDMELDKMVRMARGLPGNVQSPEQGPDSDDDDYLDEWTVDGPGKSAKSRETAADTSSQDVDPTYDPDMDDDDQKWIDSVRRLRHCENAGDCGNAKPLPNSDAVLNCPACFVVLCLDCQRHDTYQHQYRAMFVMNCTADMSQSLSYPEPKGKRGKGKKHKGNKHPEPTSSNADEETYHPVKCDQCSTQVAVFDKDEVYHFFHVLASYS